MQEEMNFFSEITVADLDNLVEKISKLEDQKEIIEISLKEKNKEISLLEMRAIEILKSLERESYSSPYGSITIKPVMNIVQPEEDRKHELWEWMRTKGIFERYATVNSNSLKALFKKERELAIENGGDPITFALPGMVPATFFKKLEFKAKKD